MKIKMTIIQPYIAAQAVFVQAYQGSARVSANLGPITLAGLTPDNYDIQVVNEHIESVNYDEPVDLVCISTVTANSTRAYRIADKFRRKGITVILGGIHASLLPDEAINHADAVVIGEAEYVWKKCLNDWEKGFLKPFYKSDRLTDMQDISTPRRDLELTVGFHEKIEASRGCPFKCEFCATNIHFGSTHRVRPIENIIKEILSFYRYKKQKIMFTDDNIIGNIPFAKKMFNAIKSLDIRWYSQCSLNIADKPELLKLAGESGCTGLSIGFETLSAKNLKSVKKLHNNSKNYEEQIKKLQDNGIEILANFVFGFDHDDKSVFEHTVDFIVRNKLRAYLTILTPYPGTELRNKMILQDRILHSDWEKYDVSHCVFKPKLMKPEELEEGFYWAYKQVYPQRKVIAKNSDELYGDNPLTKLSKELVKIKRNNNSGLQKNGIGIKELLEDLCINPDPRIINEFKSCLEPTLDKKGYSLDKFEKLEITKLLSSPIFDELVSFHL